MGTARKPLPVKLFVGMLSSDPKLFDKCASLISSVYGEIDYETEVLPWNTTDYYRAEMGDTIARKFIFLKGLMDPGRLAEVKNFTNNIEEQYSLKTASGIRRQINIDPGYVTEAKVVLATTKDYSHRVYIGENIYAEVTLRYSNKNKGFVPFDHSYFDFRTEQYRQIFDTARSLLRTSLSRVESTRRNSRQKE